MCTYLTQHRHGVHSRDEAGEHQGLCQGEVKFLELGHVGVVHAHSAGDVISNIDLRLNYYFLKDSSSLKFLEHIKMSRVEEPKILSLV